MYTPVHLIAFILNLFLPLFWMFIIIRDLRRYYLAKTAIRLEVERMSVILEALDEPDADASIELKARYAMVKSNYELFKAKSKSDMIVLKTETYIWLVLAIAMTINAILNSVTVTLKLYHKECPCEFRDMPAIEQPVKDTVLMVAKEGDIND